MIRGIHGKLASIFAVLIAAVMGTGARAEQAPPFATPAQARAYLSQNPDGPWAQAAFRIIALASIGPMTQGFPQDGLIDGHLRKRAPDAPLTDAQIADLMQLLAQAPGAEPIIVPSRSNSAPQRGY